MANRPQQLTLPPPRTWTRTDFAARRAFVQRVPPATIARLYFDPDTAPHAASADALERYLRTMRDDLVQLALLHGSPVLADRLKASIRQHDSAKLTAVTLKMVEAASKLAAAVPLATHPVGLWFRPLIARRLTGEGISTSIAPTARGCSTSVSRATRSATRMTWATTGITRSRSRRKCSPRHASGIHAASPDGAHARRKTVAARQATRICCVRSPA
jgi:integrase/recombinase XerD